jgi:hypothetical protein
MPAGKVSLPHGDTTWQGCTTTAVTVVVNGTSDKVEVARYDLAIGMELCPSITLTANGEILILSDRKIK